jgi:folate-binding Fe-S cluster repair protein YgfZ
VWCYHDPEDPHPDEEDDDSVGLFHNTALLLQGKGCIDFLNNQLSSTSCYFKQAALLTAKGRLIDCLGVAVTSLTRAYLLPSPGHSSRDLWKRLDRYIFPFDQVQLTRLPDALFQFTLASVDFSNIQRVWERDIRPRLNAAAATATQTNRPQQQPPPLRLEQNTSTPVA